MAYFDKYGVEFSDDSKTLVKCPEDFHGAYTIPDGVTKIKGEAFMFCSDLISIVIPDSVIEIEQAGIRSCRNLQSIVIGKGVLQMEDCLVGCDSLCSIVCRSNMRFSNYDLLRDTEWYQLQPDGAVIIGATLIKYKLSPNEHLKEYKIPDNVLFIARDAFDDCKELESIDFNNTIKVECLLPDSVSSINASGNALQETGSFDNTIWYKNQPCGCVNIGSLLYEYKTDNEKYPRVISIPETISAINKLAFYALRQYKDDTCDGIEPFIVICNETLTTIGESAFEGSAISEIILSKGLRTIQNKAFSNSLLNSINLPESVEKIGEEAFAECKLTSIHIPASITNIPKRAFGRNHSLVNVSLSPFLPGVKEIEEDAFAECDIRSVYLPDSIRRIEYGAFSNNRALKSVFLSKDKEIIYYDDLPLKRI